MNSPQSPWIPWLGRTGETAESRVGLFWGMPFLGYLKGKQFGARCFETTAHHPCFTCDDLPFQTQLLVAQWSVQVEPARQVLPQKEQLDSA